jgi:hypothetical protein
MLLRNLVSLAGVASLVALFSGCAADSIEPTSAETDTSEEAITGTSVQYFRVVARDVFRKCAFPMCGGVYVSRVNFAKTKCIDGTWAKSCYVSEFDFGKLGLPAAQASNVLSEAQAGNVVVKAKFATKKYGKQLSSTILSVSAAWQSPTQIEPTGAFYSVTDSGIVCITSPCPTVHESKLNSTVKSNVTGLDLSATGLDEGQVSSVFSALGGEGVVIAGKNVVAPEAGPAGDGKDLVASAVYFAVKAQAGYCEIDEDCTMTQYAAPVESKSDCYCTTCGDATDTTSAAENEADYLKICKGVKQTCPAVKCMYREARCVKNACTAVQPTPAAFCGGIAAIQCPAGFECALDGSYPDAGGTCVACSVPSCAAPPAGCHYEAAPVETGACPTGCGKLACDGALLGRSEQQIGRWGWGGGVVERDVWGAALAPQRPSGPPTDLCFGTAPAGSGRRGIELSVRGARGNAGPPPPTVSCQRAAEGRTMTRCETSRSCSDPSALARLAGCPGRGRRRGARPRRLWPRACSCLACCASPGPLGQPGG